MSSFIPTLPLLEKLVPELLSMKPRLTLTYPKISETLKTQYFNLLETAVRRWIIMDSLYDDTNDYCFSSIETFFQCSEWQKFISEHCPNLKSATCRELVFSSYSESVLNTFTKKLQNQYKFSPQDLDLFLDKSPFNKITDRTIRNYFNELSKLTPFPLLEKLSGGKYQKVSDNILEKFLKYTPENASYSPSILGEDGIIELNFIKKEMSSIVELFFSQIQGQQRLFLHHDYIVPQALQDNTTDNADRLRTNWQKSPINPLKIHYYSASINRFNDYIIYPVCLHYYQRAYYLSAWGEYPHQNNSIPLQWYNFRLERIDRLEELAWNYPQLPFTLQNIEEKAINPEYIKKQLEKAYGFDFYQPKMIGLLKFCPLFAEGYINNSYRHDTFEKINDIQEVLSIIEAEDFPEKTQIIDKVKQASDYAYYLFTYRQHDYNVIMRLRSWSPNVEVLLPLDLRQRMREDSQKTWLFYQDLI